MYMNKTMGKIKKNSYAGSTPKMSQKFGSTLSDGPLKEEKYSQEYDSGCLRNKDCQ